MEQHFIPRDATVAELERKAADAEEKASNESEPRATELREEAKLYRAWAASLRSGGGRLERVVSVNACFQHLSPEQTNSSDRGIILPMRRIMYAVSVACAFTFVPIGILRLNSETPFVKSLKNIAAALGVPGAFFGWIAAFGRIHDIDSAVTDAANFAFYFLITWLLLKGLSRIRTHEA